MRFEIADAMRHPRVIMNTNLLRQRRHARVAINSEQFIRQTEGLQALEGKQFTLIQTASAIHALAQRQDIPAHHQSQLLSQGLTVLHHKIEANSGTNLADRLSKAETQAVKEPLIAIANRLVQLHELHPDFIQNYRFDPLTGIAQQYLNLYRLLDHREYWKRDAMGTFRSGLFEQLTPLFLLFTKRATKPNDKTPDLTDAIMTSSKSTDANRITKILQDEGKTKNLLVTRNHALVIQSLLENLQGYERDTLFDAIQQIAINRAWYDTALFPQESIQAIDAQHEVFATILNSQSIQTIITAMQVHNVSAKLMIHSLASVEQAMVEIYYPKISRNTEQNPDEQRPVTSAQVMVLATDPLLTAYSNRIAAGAFSWNKLNEIIANTHEVSTPQEWLTKIVTPLLVEKKQALAAGDLTQDGIFDQTFLENIFLLTPGFVDQKMLFRAFGIVAEQIYTGKRIYDAYTQERKVTKIPYANEIGDPDILQLYATLVSSYMSEKIAESTVMDLPDELFAGLFKKTGHGELIYHAIWGDTLPQDPATEFISSMLTKAYEMAPFLTQDFLL